MKRVIYILPVLLSLSLAACTKKVGAPFDEPLASSADNNSSFIEGEIYVKFTPQFTREIEDGLADGNTKAISSLNQAVQVQSMERLFPYAGEFEPRTRKEGLHQWYVVRFDSGTSSTKASFDLGDLEFVEIAEPVRRVAMAGYDDPYYHLQWDLYNDGQGNRKTAGIDMNIERVWDEYSTGDPSVIVCVVDEGVDANHPDLEFNYVGGYNFVENSQQIKAGDHGSHVAGTIAATNNNGKGIRGIAGGDYAAGRRGVGIFSCQVFSGDRSGGFINAIKYGADHGAVISQNSWGNDYSQSKNPYQSAKADHASKALIDAINYFVKYAGCDNDGNQLPDSPMKGGVVIFAAGNDNWDANCICSECDVIAVAAVSSTGDKASYSNYGPWVDICAPGGEMSWGNAYGIASTVPDGYAYMQGTSMACPHVSGEAALIASYFGGPGFTNETLMEKLLKGANAGKPSKTYAIGPLADVLGSFKYGNTPPPAKVETLRNTGVRSNFADFTFKSVADAYGAPASAYVLMATRNLADFDDIDPKKLPSSVIGVTIPGTDREGVTVNCTLALGEFEADYYVAVVAIDEWSVHSELSNIVELTTGENHAPVITTEYKGDYKVRVTQPPLEVDFYVSDPDGHDFTTWVNHGSFFSADGRHYLLRLDAKGMNPGIYQGKIVAEDKYKARSVYEFSYEVLENHAPEIVAALPNRVFKQVGESVTIDLSDYMVDPDGDELTYEAESSDEGVLQLQRRKAECTFTTMGFGACEVKLTAIDPAGKSCQTSFKVLVQSEPVSVKCDNYNVVITIAEQQSTDARVTIVSQTGRVMYEKESSMSAFEPLDIPVKDWAPGYYDASIVYGSNTASVKFLKL